MTADISVVVPAHAEGRILLPTLRSVRAAADVAGESGIPVELVIVADRIAEETRPVLDAHADSATLGDVELQVLEVDNGDLGLSRNDGIAAATAPVIAVLDGDNLISTRWLIDGLEQVRAHGDRTIVHPETIISFGARHTRWDLVAGDAPDFPPGLLAAVNPWDACVIASRAVFETVPYLYLPPTLGLGPEDWAWNLETLDAGFTHVVAPRTAMFYRVRPGSLLAAHGDNLLPPVGFLSSLDRAEAALNDARLFPRAIPRTGRDVFREVVPFPVRRALRDTARGTRSVARRVVRRIGREGAPIAPVPSAIVGEEWLHHEWAAANRLEPEVPFPRADAVARYSPWGHPWGEWDRERAAAYWGMLRAFGGAPDFLFVCPWVRTGGGDRVMLQYIASVRRTRPDARIVLLTTEPDRSTRLSEVPEGVRVVELRDFLSRHVDREWMVSRLLPQLFTQAAPRTMHLFNSTVGYDVVERFGRVLSRKIAIFVSTFVLDRTPDGERTSVLFYRHPRFLDPVQAVLVDSRAFAETMVREQGYDREKFWVQHQIVPDLPMVARASRTISDSAPLRVLWAGRFDLQKRLDVLADVAEEIVRRGLPVRIDYYGEAVMGDPDLETHLARLDAAGAVRHPAYSHIGEVALDRYDVYLMTSEWEGVPNTLLEAMTVGVPAIAPLVGGVGEVLDERTGYPVERFDDAGLYADALEAVLSDVEQSRDRAQAAHDLVRAKFSVEAFDEGMESVPHYLDGLADPEGEADAVSPEEPEIRFVADDETLRFLASDAPRVLMFAGSAGYANYGDVLQHKNVLRQWAESAPDRTPVSVFHVGSAGSPEHLAALRDWYRTRHIVFFHRPDEEIPEWLAPTPSAEGAAWPTHVVGGGYLNKEWGPGYIAVIDAMADQLGAETFLFSGMQIDDFIVPHIVDFAERREVSAFGTRDRQSFARVRAALGDRAAHTFDDLWEIISAWEAAPPTPSDRPFRLGLHINASGYVGDDVIAHISEMLGEVLQRHPDARVTLLNAYDDRRAEVVDTLAALRLFDDTFPFATFDVVDLARISLETAPGEPTPEGVARLDLDAAITCSYHTAMTMNALGVPAFLLRRSAYYAQKAEIFGLPDDFATFIDAPERYLKDFAAEDAERRAWTARLAAWIRGESVALGEPA